MMPDNFHAARLLHLANHTKEHLLKDLARYPLLLVLLLTCSSFGLAQNGESSRKQVAQPASNPEVWQEFQSAEGRFAVQLPGTPMRRRTPPVDTILGKIDRHSYWLRLSNQSPQFDLSYFDIPGEMEVEDKSAALNAARDESLKAVKGKLLQEKEDNSLGHPARFYKVQTPDGMMRIRGIFVKNRYYSLIFTSVGKNETVTTARLNDETAAKFLDSFRLLSEQELAKFEGEVDRLLKALREKNEVVIGGCTEEAKCEPVSDTDGSADANKDAFKSGGIVSKPQPVYPLIAKAARAQGVVKVQVIVDEEGKVIAAQVAIGHPLLQAAAVKAARAATFAPTLLEGKPVKIAGEISYNFVLQ